MIEEAYAERGRLLKRFDTETYPDHIRQIARGVAEGIGLAFRVDVWNDKEVNALYQKEVEGRLRFA